MALMKMQKVAIFFPRSDRDRLLSLLQDEGRVEMLDLKESSVAEDVEVSEVTSVEADRIASDVKRAIEDLHEFEEKGGILGGFGGGRVIVTKDEFENIVRDFDFESVLKEIEELESRRTELRTRLTHLESFIARLEPWLNLDVPLEEIASTENVAVVMGSLTGRSPQALAKALAEVSGTYVMEVVSQQERQAHLILWYHRVEAEVVEEVLRRNDFEAETFEDLKGLPGELTAEANREIAGINSELEKLRARGAELVRHKPRLMIVHDYFDQEAHKAHAQALVGTTERVGVIQGWVRRHEFDQLVKEVTSAIDSAEVLKIEPEPGESPPIELKNRWIIKPFEVITELYGMPHAREVDPTPLAAPFFALFFGFCLTDAGYGIVLIILSLLLMKYLRTGHKLLWLIFAGGLTTIFMGAITGGWFGLTEETIPPWLGFVATLRRTLMQFDPLKNPMLMFGIALALGFIQVTFGLIIEMIENFRARDALAAVFDQISWIVLLWSAVLFGAAKIGAIEQTHISVFKWAAIGAAIAIIGFSHRVGKNPVVRLGWGLYNLYGITGYLGDVLSYARLLALGLATGGIAMVINAVALMAKGIPGVGYAAMILVLAGGHTLNIAVNALGGFVHSARLQYVEFYPKFFEGGGKRFKPFARELKYTHLVEKAS